MANLAAAYAECGDFEKAVEYQNKAIELVQNNVGDFSYSDNEERLVAYEAKKPWRDLELQNEYKEYYTIEE